MVIDINDTLLESIKKELLDTLRAAEVRVVDMFEFGETHGSDETLNDLHSVKATLQMIGESGAAALCESIRLAIVDAIENNDIEEHEGLADSFLTLSQYVERLSTDSSHTETVNREQQLLANAQNALSAEKSGANGIATSDTAYPLNDKQKKIVTSAVNALSKLDSANDNVFWQGIYKTAKVVKGEVNTQESHELIWLIEQAAILNVKGDLSTKSEERGRIFSAYQYYLQAILNHGETLAGYQQPVISDAVTLLKQISSAHEVLHNDYRPPVQKLQVAESSGLSVVFPVSAETIETIAFLVKKELATTKQLFEQAIADGDPLTDIAKTALLDSLKLPKATFHLLNFTSGKALIEEAEELLHSGKSFDVWQANFAEDLILVEDALWQLDFLERTGIVNPYDAATHQKLHTKNMATEAAKIIVAESAHEFFKSARENLIENFDSTDQLDLIAGAKEIHYIHSSIVLLGEEELAEQLTKAEQLQLFLINKPELLEDSLNANYYMDVLVGYEIIFEQLQASLTVDQRALKILTDAQNQLSATVHFNPEQMAAVDYLQKSTSIDGMSVELEQENIIGEYSDSEVADSEVESALDELELESLDVDNEDESLNIDAADASKIQSDWGAAKMSPALAGITQNAVPDDNVESIPASELDDEILEIFLEEGHGIAKQLEANITELAGNYYNDALISEIRRAFHTLKGSGRMVGLNVFGEFAWQHEELLNKVVSGEITLNDATQELFVNSHTLVEKTVNSEPFTEDREALLLAAAQAKALREMLLSGEPLPTASVEAQPTEPSAAGEGLSLGDDDKDLTTAGLAATGGADVASLLSEADLEAVADKLSDRAIQKEQQAQETLQQVSSHPALSASAEITNAQDEKVQKIAQAADLIGGLGDGIVHEDLAAVFHALSKIDRSAFDGSRQQLAQQLDKVAELSRENLGNQLEQSQIEDVSQAIKSLLGSSTETDIANSEAAIKQLESAWTASKEEGLALDFNSEEDVSWAFGYIDANAKLFDAWRKDDFTKQRAFNGLRQNMIGFERLLLNNHIHNPIAVAAKVRELLDTISGSNLTKISDEEITNAVKNGIEEIRNVLEVLQNGDRDAIASTDVLADIEHAISMLNEQSARLVSAPAEQSSDTSVEFDWSLSEGDATQAGGTNASSKIFASEVPTDDTDSMVAPAMPVQLPPQAIVSGYLGTAGSLGDNISAVKAQFLPENLARGDFQHSQLIDSIYDVEASLDSQDAPSWAWEALSNLESVVSSMHDKSLLPSPADYDRITKALEAIQNSDGIDTKQAKNVNNSLMGLRAELTARRETAALAKEFADTAHNELEATDQSFGEWKSSGFNPQGELSSLIDNIDGIREQSRAVEYEDAEELSSLVNTVLKRLKEDNVVPFEEISDIVGEAVSKITTVSSQFHGDSLATPELKESLQQQGVVTPVGVEYVPLNNIDDLRDISPVSQSEVTDVVTKGVNVPAASQSDEKNLEQSNDAVEITDVAEKASEEFVDNALSHSAETESTEVETEDKQLENVVSQGSESAIDSTVADGSPLYFDDSSMTDAQKQSFVKQAERHIKASREQFDRWEETGFVDEPRLEHLSKNVDSISQLSETHSFQSAQNLSSLVGEVLGRIYNEALVPNELTAAAVSDAIDEFGRTNDAIRRKDQRLGKQSVNPDLLANMRNVASMTSLGAPLTASADENTEVAAERRSRHASDEERLPASTVSDGDTNKSESSGYQETDYQSYIEEVRLAIEDSQDSFDNWKASEFEDEREFEALTDNVKEITETSEKHGFESGADLGKSVGGVLSQIAESGDKPSENEAQQLEAAVNEFSRSAVAIQSGQGDKGIRESVIDSVKQVMHQVKSVDSGQSETVDQQDVQPTNYQDYVDDARSALSDSQSNFNDWKASDFKNHQDSHNVSSSVEEITETSEKHDFGSGAALGKSIDSILSEASKEEAAPEKQVIDEVETELNEFASSATAIETGQEQQEISSSAIGSAELVAEKMVSADSVEQVASELTDELADTDLQSTAYVAYAKEAMTAIESSKNSFNDWKSAEFELNDEFDKLSDHVNDISVTSQKHGVDSATELANSVSEILSQVMADGVTPNHATTENIESAIDEFARSAKAIQDDKGVQEIRQEVIASIQGLINRTDNTQPAISSSATTYSLFNESDSVDSPVISKSVNVGEEASSLAAQLASQPISDFEQVVNQSAEQSVTVTDKLPTATVANDYEGLKYNDPNTLDETILDIFLNEAKELVVENNTSAADWKADHDDLSALQSIQRGLHTLKGGARMAELTVLGDLSHNIEALLDAIVDGQIADKDGAHAVLQSGLNLTSEMVTLADSQQVIVESPEYYEMLNTFLREQTSKGLELPAPKRQIVEKDNLGDEDDSQDLVSHQPAPVDKHRKSQQRRSYMMRISSDLVDKLTRLIGEDVISHSRIERQLMEHGFQIDELSRTVNRVSEQLRRLENETEAQILFRHDTIDDSSKEDFDPLELDRFSEIQQLSRLLAESMHDLESIRGTLTEFVDGTRQILLDQNNIQRELQDGVLSASLVRFDSVAPRFERMVEQVADELGKEVMVQIYGGHNDIERNMLEDLIPGFEHTIRNSLAHGIETPEEREKVGKPRQGRIRIAVRREGAEIGFMIADDGRGANLDAIRDKARRLNMLDESKADDKNYLLQLLFEPGFSTQEQATQISGRGIGMDVLRDVINAHQGSIDIESEIGKGMATFIRLPFAMSITEALSVQIGRYHYAVPVMSIEGIARIPHEDYKIFESGQPTFHTYGQNRYKVESLIQFIDPYAERIYHPQGVPVLLVRVGSKRLALEVEEIGSRQEVIIKSVNPQFTSLPGIIGATVLDNGMPVPVMEATTLGRHFLNFTQIGTDVKDVINPEVLEQTDVQPKVLVVDDSITMRKVTTKILGRYDVEYQTAKDGLDAIDVINDWTPNVILLDIEMPRMDGFEFATHIRNDSAIKNVPIIMITSRTGSKHRERAEGIGVNDYLGKPYTEETLIASLESILNKKLHK